MVTGTPTEDQTLGVDVSGIADADGLGAFSYQWLRDGVAIAGATAATYTLGDAEVGTDISVRVTYIDGLGTAESLTSAQVGPVGNVNDVPTGLPVVVGSLVRGDTLAANTTAIADADGLGAFSYQWLRDGVAIAGATGQTYTLVNADVGADLRVRVSYTDGHGTAESLTSAPVGPVTHTNQAPTGAPVITGTPTEDQTLGVDVSAIADADGLGAFSHQWLRDGVAIAGATGATYTLGDDDVGADIRVRVRYTDGLGTSETLTSAPVGPIANVNDAPTGLPVIDGTPEQGQTLSADTSAIADADGLGPFDYQWLRNGLAIAGATGGSYQLSSADAGALITVRMQYIDGHGTAESLTSAAVGPVGDVNDAPVLTPGGPTALTPITEDDLDNPGQTVASFVGGTVSDPDGPGLPYGIAIIGLDSGNGRWQFDTGGGWTDVGSVGDSAALLLDASDKVRFVPNGERGTSAALHYRAWDHTTGTPGARADATTTGGASAFSVASHSATLAVADVNDAPVIDGGPSAAFSIPENSQAVTVVTARDVDSPVLTFSIAGGADAALFEIDPASGLLSLRAPPDHEAPLDADGDNVYEVTVQVSDGALTDTQAIAVTVTDSNESGVGPLSDTDPAPDSVPENAANGTPVGITAFAQDPDSTDTVAYSLADSAGGRFAIDAASGVVTVANGSRLDYESATGHAIVVRATSSDGSYSERGFTIALQDVNEAVISPVRDIDPAADAVDENAPNGTAVGITAFAQDLDGTASVRYALADSAGGRFAIDAASGVVSVADGSRLDYESATSHSITVVATSSDGSSSQRSFTIAVTDLPDGQAPVITSAARFSVPENSAGAGTVTASDADTPAAALRYAIVGGADAARLVIDAQSGALRFVAAPDYEAPADADGDNLYELLVEVSDGQLRAQLALTVQVTPVNDNAPRFVSEAHVQVPANTTVVTTVQAVDADLPAETLAYTIVGGADAARFGIDAASGALRLLGAAEGERVYEVVVGVSDGLHNATLAMTVRVAAGTGEERPPEFPGSSTRVAVPELQAAVTTVRATDPLGRALLYSIAGGADGGLFSIDAASGALRFNTAPQFAQPRDADRDNVYEVLVLASNGVQSSRHVVYASVLGQQVEMPGTGVPVPVPVPGPGTPTPGGGAVAPGGGTPRIGDGDSSGGLGSGSDRGDGGGDAGIGEAAGLLPGMGGPVVGGHAPGTGRVPGIVWSTAGARAAGPSLLPHGWSLRLSAQEGELRALELPALLLALPGLAGSNQPGGGPSSSRGGQGVVTAAETEGPAGGALEGRADIDEALVGGVAVGLGAAFWASRGGALLASLLAMSPAWKSVDPLPVLTRRGRAAKRDKPEALVDLAQEDEDALRANKAGAQAQAQAAEAEAEAEAGPAPKG